MTEYGLLKIGRRYWRLPKCIDLLESKPWIKAGLRVTNRSTDIFIKTVNEAAGFEWIGEELDISDENDRQVVYSRANASYIWIITLHTRRIELKERQHVSEYRNQYVWRTSFNVIISRY